MDKRFRLRNRSDFERVRQTGKSYAHPLVVLIVSSNPEERIKVGITTGRSVGSAVERNRIKRQLRAAVHQYLPKLKPGTDLILIGRKSQLDAGFTDLSNAVFSLLTRANVLSETGHGNLVQP